MNFKIESDFIRVGSYILVDKNIRFLKMTKCKVRGEKIV